MKWNSELSTPTVAAGGGFMARSGRLVVSVAFLLLTAVPGLWAEVVRVVADHVEVRREANAGANVLGTVNKGTVLQVLGREGGWINVAYPIGNGAFYSGYVPAVLAEDARGAAPSSAVQAPQSVPPVSASPAPAPLPQTVAAPPVSPAPTVPMPTTPAAAPIEPAPAPSTVRSAVPRVELSVGYSYLYADWLSDDVGGSVPYGAVFAANFNLTPWLGLVVDLGGHYKSVEVSLPGYGTGDLGLTVGSLHGGVRLSGRRSSSITPYAQFLAGGTTYQQDIDGESIGDLGTDFSIQPGVGIIFGLSDRVGLEVGADYRRVFAEGEGVNEFRARVGVAFRIGSK